MSWQSEIIQDETPQPPRLVIYGPGGIGKTTFGASLPNPLIVDYDKGAGEIRNAKKLPGRATWQANLSLLREIAKDPGSFRSLVIDTADVLEDQAEVEVCEELKCKTIGEPKWGAGYDALEAKWRILLAELDQVRAAGLTICILAHTIIRTANDPTVGDYDEYVSQLQKKVWAATYRWADFVGFASFNIGRLDKESRAIVTGDRELHTQRGSGFQAKNRYRLPLKLDLDWTQLDAGIRAFQTAAVETAETVTKRIVQMAEDADKRGMKTSDGKPFSSKATELIAQCRHNVGWLLELENSLKAKFAAAPPPSPNGQTGATT